MRAAVRNERSEPDDADELARASYYPAASINVENAK